MELEWNIFPGFNTLQLSDEVKSYCPDWEKRQKISREESYLCRCSTTFLVEQKTMNKNVWQMPNSFLCMQKDLVKDKWSFIGPGSEKKRYSIKEDSP